MKRVAVIGAGWSGLACALELARRGFPVTLADAAPQVGGRARAVDVRLGDRSFRLDNGQHLLVGAYGQTLRLMQAVGVDIDRVLLRLPFELRYPDGFRLRAWRLPAPMHLAAALLSARGWGWKSRRSVLAFVGRWRRRRWQIAEDTLASALFADAPAQAVRRLWRPLCLAALNVELEQASARVLLAVLRDSLAGPADAADLLVPRRDLTQVFAGPALARLRAQGADVQLRNPVHRLAREGEHWRIESRGRPIDADALVLALPPDRAADLLATARQPEFGADIAALREIGYAPIATVYLRYPPAVRLARPAFALLDQPADRRFGQWVFDRGQLDAESGGVFSVVVSAAADALAQGAGVLADSVAEQLAADFSLPRPLATSVLAEKRATIVPAPGLRRPPARLAVPGAYLAGDAAASDYPSTLEGSVRAGLAAAAAIVEDRRPAAT